MTTELEPCAPHCFSFVLIEGAHPGVSQNQRCTKKSGSGAKDGSVILNNPPLLVAACEFCERAGAPLRDSLGSIRPR